MDETQELNNVDPKVMFDPIDFNNFVIAMINTDTSTSTDVGDHKSIKYDGILYPIVRINNHVLDYQRIIQMHIYHKDFLPTIDIKINDINNLILKTDSTGMNNEIDIIIRNQLDGSYKSIKLSFYITYCQSMGQIMYCSGILKFMPFEKIKFKAFEKSNTYKFLYNIAKEVGLGYSVTNNTETIQDIHCRLVLNKKYKDIIPELIKFSGIDSQSMFDCWLDLYGYINFVNVSYLMNEKIDTDKLKIKSVIGFLTENTNDLQYLLEVNRVISNSRDFTNTNLMIRHYEVISNNSSITNDGIFRDTQSLQAEGSSITAGNNILTQVADIRENSVDGNHTEDYNFEGYNFIGIETDDVPIIYQTNLRNRYFNQLRTKLLKVVLENINIGLVRGMMVMVQITEEDPLAKRIQLYNQNVPLGGKSKDKLTDYEKSIMYTSDPILNTQLSGIYYIDSVEYDYDIKSKILQTLFLIKQGPWTNYINKYSN